MRWPCFIVADDEITKAVYSPIGCPATTHDLYVGSIESNDRACVYADVIHQVLDIFDGFVLGVQPINRGGVGADIATVGGDVTGVSTNGCVITR